MPLGHRDQAGFARRRDRSFSRRLDAVENSLEILGGIGGYGRRCGGHRMPSAVERAKLARAALALNAACRLPSLILMTDEKRLRDPVAAAQLLPKGRSEEHTSELQ